MVMEVVNSALYMLAFQAPQLVVCAVGLAVALSNRSRSPRVASLVIGAMAILLVWPVVFAFLSTYLWHQAAGSGGQRNVMPQALAAFGSILHAAAIGLLLAAALGGSKTEPSAPT